MILQKILHISTTSTEEVINITGEVLNVVKESGIDNGLVNVFLQGSTAALLIQENWDGTIQRQTLLMLNQLIGNNTGQSSEEKADKKQNSYLKASILRSSETIPVINGKIGFSIWQNIFLYEFDGPRKQRVIVISIYEFN